MFPDRLRPAEIIESYYLETLEGLFFAVKGLEHPPDRLISVIRYVPDREKGDRKRGDVCYRRLYQFGEQERLLQSSYPQYLAFDSTSQMILQCVPRSFIRQIYDPRVRLRSLCAIPVKDALEEEAVTFANLLQREAGIPWSGIGITGSLLISLHRDSSDLDLSIFGLQNCRHAYNALQGLVNSQCLHDLRRFNDAEIEALYRQRLSDTKMSFKDFSRSEKDKICQGIFRERPYFIRFIKSVHEAGMTYGNVRYTALGRATITALVADDSDSIFTPCSYRLSNVCILEGPIFDIDHIVSFRGRFCEQARTGDTIRASGTLERVEHASGKIRYRLLLGNSAADTMVAELQ